MEEKLGILLGHVNAGLIHPPPRTPRRANLRLNGFQGSKREKVVALGSSAGLRARPEIR